MNLEGINDVGRSPINRHSMQSLLYISSDPHKDYKEGTFGCPGLTPKPITTTTKRERIFVLITQMTAVYMLQSIREITKVISGLTEKNTKHTT